MMKKAEIVEANKPLVISETSIPEPPIGGLVVKVSYSGVCHSDVHQWEDKFEQGDLEPLRMSQNPFYKLPVVPGHEISGKVYSLGSGSNGGLKVGDRVVVYPWIGCGKCGFCQNDNPNLCLSGHEFIGFRSSGGGYANFLIVREEKFALKLPDSIPMDVACMFSCSALTAYGAVTATLPFVEKSIAFTGNSRLLINGAGGLGLWGIQFAKKILPDSCSVTVVDINKEKLEVAKSLGSDEVVCLDPTISDAEAIQLIVSKGQFAGVIDFVNNTVTANRVVNCVQKNGILVMIGLFGGQAHFSLPRIVLGNVTIRGLMTSNLQSMKNMLNLASEQKLTPPPMQYYKLEEVNDILTLIREGKMKGRGIIDCSDV